MSARPLAVERHRPPTCGGVSSVSFAEVGDGPVARPEGSRAWGRGSEDRSRSRQNRSARMTAVAVKVPHDGCHRGAARCCPAWRPRPTRRAARATASILSGDPPTRPSPVPPDAIAESAAELRRALRGGCWRSETSRAAAREVVYLLRPAPTAPIPTTAAWSPNARPSSARSSCASASPATAPGTRSPSSSVRSVGRWSIWRSARRRSCRTAGGLRRPRPVRGVPVTARRHRPGARTGPVFAGTLSGFLAAGAPAVSQWGAPARASPGLAPWQPAGCPGARVQSNGGQTWFLPRHPAPAARSRARPSPSRARLAGVARRCCSPALAGGRRPAVPGAGMMVAPPGATLPPGTGQPPAPGMPPMPGMPGGTMPGTPAMPGCRERPPSSRSPAPSPPRPPAPSAAAPSACPRPAAAARPAGWSWRW